MISKHLKPRAQNSQTPFGKLGRYIAAPREEGERLEDLWIVNTVSGETLDDLELCIMEIEAQQALNTRVKKTKHYHLLVSFRDEHPPLEVLKDIELEFAKALGFEDHPRVVGTHVNTDNFHMHVGYSRIHPVTFKAHEPGHDYKARTKVCREMEKKYGLKVDLRAAFDLDSENKSAPDKSRDYEAHRWEESFHSYIQRLGPAIKATTENLSSWEEMHKATALYGFIFQPRGKGMVIKNLEGGESIKASSLGTEFAHACLTGRLGDYEPAKLPLHDRELGFAFDSFEEDALSLKEVLESNIVHYAEAHRELIRHDVQTAQNWQQLHHRMQVYHLRFFERGNGLVLADTKNLQNAIPASELGREFSKQKLVAAFGPYEKINHNYHAETKLYQHHHALMRMIENTESWQTLNHAAQDDQFMLRVQKNGLRFVDLETGQQVDPAIINGKFNIKDLTDKLGPYQRYEKAHSVYEKARPQVEKIRTLVSACSDWHSLHREMREMGLQLRHQRNGLHIVDLKSKLAIKYSAVDPYLAYDNLKTLLGSYQKPAKGSYRGKTATPFLATAKEHKDLLLQMVKHNTSWKGLHEAGYELGWQFRVQKNGLHLLDIQSGATIPAKLIDPKLTTARLEKQLGAYERSPLTKSHRYGKRPLHSSPVMSATFKRYLGHKKKAGLSATVFRSWKEFLMAGALGDPLAMAFLHLQNTLLREVDQALSGKDKAQTRGQSQDMNLSR